MSRRTSIALALAFVAAPLTAQKILPLPEVGTVQPYSFVSKTATNSTQDLLLVDQHVVRRAGASFLQLEFADVKLSEESVLEIESLKDGEKQTYEFDTYDPKAPFSVYFNGDAVKVSLWAGRGASDDKFSIKSIAVGHKDVVNPLTICGPTDNRTLRNDRRVARIILRRGTSVSWCTAWLISRHNCFATAGHCLSGTSSVTAQFNVPLSSSSGTLRNPPTSSQYVWTGTRYFQNSGIGNDWGVFTTNINSSTRRHAGAVQDNYYRFSSSTIVNNTTRITGHGSRSSPRTYNAVGQTHTGPFRSRSGNAIRYRVDTTGGNSGSPVTNSSDLAIGVHTHGGCRSTGTTSSNAGTYQAHSTFVSRRALLCRTVDLRVDTFSGPSVVVNGMTYGMSCRIRNYGNTSSTSCLSGFYVSTNSVISAFDTLLLSFSTPALAPNGFQNYSNSRVRIPTTVRPGTCYIGALADRNDVNGELSESNNYRARTTTCRGNLPNLAPLAVQISSTTMVPGGLYTLGCRMHNTGSATAATSRTGIYLSTNSLISRLDRLIATYSTPSIAAGRNINQNTRFVAPINLQNATCWVGAYADYNLRVTEGNENDNNSRALQVRCVGRPDLVVTSATVASGSTWVPGGLYRVTLTVRNQGSVSSPSSIATVCMSGSSSTTSTVKNYLGGVTVSSLAPNASQTRIVSVRMPWCLSGRLYMQAYADGFRRVTEGSETNNGRNISLRTVSTYTGSTRYAEFLSPIAGNTNGAYFYTSANHRARLGSRASICVSAPRFNNYWVFPIWSASSSRTLRIDALTNLSIALPLYIPPIRQVTSGKARFTFNLPRVPTFTGSIRAYMHTVWFTPGFSGINSLSGTNPLFHNITP